VKRSDEFAMDDAVRVCDGPFTSFRGVVKDVDDERSRLSVAVTIYGRVVAAELDFGQVQRL
jgi:transcription termination/antitermination protein NusG